MSIADGADDFFEKMTFWSRVAPMRPRLGAALLAAGLWRLSVLIGR